MNEQSDPYSPPSQGDTIGCGALLLLVGPSNGDFRAVRIVDHLNRPIATGNVPFSVLDEIEAEAVRLDTEEGKNG